MNIYQSRYKNREDHLINEIIEFANNVYKLFNRNSITNIHIRQKLLENKYVSDIEVANLYAKIVYEIAKGRSPESFLILIEKDSNFQKILNENNIIKDTVEPYFFQYSSNTYKIIINVLYNLIRLYHGSLNDRYLIDVFYLSDFDYDVKYIINELLNDLRLLRLKGKYVYNSLNVFVSIYNNLDLKVDELKDIYLTFKDDDLFTTIHNDCLEDLIFKRVKNIDVILDYVLWLSENKFVLNSIVSDDVSKTIHNLQNHRFQKDNFFILNENYKENFSRYEIYTSIRKILIKYDFIILESFIRGVIKQMRKLLNSHNVISLRMSISYLVFLDVFPEIFDIVSDDLLYEFFEMCVYDTDGDILDEMKNSKYKNIALKFSEYLL